MEEYGFDAPRATLLENEGRLVDAAESRLSEGNVLEAIQLFIRDQENPAESIARAVKHFLNYLSSEPRSVEERGRRTRQATV